MNRTMITEDLEKTSTLYNTKLFDMNTEYDA